MNEFSHIKFISLPFIKTIMTILLITNSKICNFNRFAINSIKIVWKWSRFQSANSFNWSFFIRLSVNLYRSFNVVDKSSISSEHSKWRICDWLNPNEWRRIHTSYGYEKMVEFVLEYAQLNFDFDGKSLCILFTFGPCHSITQGNIAVVIMMEIGVHFVHQIFSNSHNFHHLNIHMLWNIEHIWMCDKALP